jgi:hypothetical protein
VAATIDDDVYRELERRAIPYVDRDPNDTLRRLLGLPPRPRENSTVGPPTPATTATQAVAPSPAVERPRASAPVVARGMRETSRRRKEKVRLSDLVAGGQLTRGEPLVCVDYAGAPIGEATVDTGGKLLRGGAHHSMSGLALDLFAAAGQPVTAVRGPAHWLRKSDGRSILDLWDESRA